MNRPGKQEKLRKSEQLFMAAIRGKKSAAVELLGKIFSAWQEQCLCFCIGKNSFCRIIK
jgi:hypothetical protein